MNIVPPFDAIATDLDGTFLSDTKQIPEINSRAVRLAGELGMPTVFATGRPLRWLRSLDDLALPGNWVIASNGAVTMHLATGKITAVHTMDPATALAVAQQIRAKLPNCGYAVEYAHRWGAEPGYPRRLDDAQADRLGTLPDLFTLEPVVKLLLLDPTNPTDRLAAAVEPIVAGRLTVTFSYVAQAGMLELSAPGVSKALALQDLLDRLGLTPQRLIAFGDMPNDLAMLRLAGQAYAMAGSHPSLLAAGYPIAGPNNEAAVGRTLLRLLGQSDQPGAGHPLIGRPPAGATIDP